MKHSVILKFIAVFLAACALTLALASGFGVLMVADAGLYEQDFDTWYADMQNRLAEALAEQLIGSYAARIHGGFTKNELAVLNWGNSWQTIGSWFDLPEDSWCYSIERDGAVWETNFDRKFDGATSYTVTMAVSFPKKVTNGIGCDDVFSVVEYGVIKELCVQYVQSPVYTATIWLAPNSGGEYAGVPFELYGMLMQVRYLLIVGLGLGLLLMAACLVYLCCAAGKKRSGDEPKPEGLNKLPLDLYAGAVALACYGTISLAVVLVEEFIYHGTGINWGWFTLGTVVVFAAALCIVGFLVALAAQWKMGLRWLLRHTLVGWLLCKLWQGIRFAGRMLCKLYRLLPMVWQYLLVGLAMGFFPLFFFFLTAAGRSYWAVFLFLACLTDLAIIAYGAYAFGTVLRGAQKMADGDLYTKIDTRYLIGAYRTCAENLNTLADVAVEAAKNQMRSDRMKTELITNVSHDIKTPLTSIINYIDLLQKAGTPEQTAQYLQVLSRQSQRLKKLIEDLVEMSKATTGDMAVEITRVDAAEAIHQALGEFSDKLARQELTVVFRQPESPVPILADGRLTWRVLSNLLSNVVKYALPGTRVYVDVQKGDGRVQVSIKNISREALNVSADELTERFVRGDASRNTEGSGLGLNIAKSLMELQKGHLDLLVDGDLFKVTLMFCTE